jgi:SNF2 family DNA or RNA helicase
MLSKLFEKKKITFSTLYGDMKQRDKDKSIEDFKAGKVKCLIAHPKSGGMGLTFVNCSYNIWFSISYSQEEFYQANARIHRAGQKNACTYILLLAADSIDMIIHQALLKKQRLNEVCLELLKKGKV